MGLLRKLLELYKDSLQIEEEREEKVEIAEDTKIDIPTYKRKEESYLENPEEGIVFELVPSMDSQEMLFLILEVKEDFTIIIPLTRWWEFATLHDVIIHVKGKPYMAQTDLAINVPTQGFAQWFEERLYEIAKLPKQILKRIKTVYEGKKKGDGTLVFPEKEEFKKLEARRYAPLWYRMIESSEELAKLNEALKQLRETFKEEALPKAAEVQPIHGSGKGVEFFYNEEEKILYLYPLEKYVGKRGKITFSFRGKTFFIYKGILKKEIKIPLSSEAYNYKLFQEGLKVELF